MDDVTCTGDGCDSTEILAKGMCLKHYQRWWKHGDPEVTKNRWGLDRDASTKQCATCKQILPVDDFYKRKDNKTGTPLPLSRCKECYREHDRAMARQRNLAATYSMTLEQFNVLVIRQKGVCAICGKPPSSGAKGGHLFVDHDHGTGAVRGLLCSRCNVGLGMFRDSPELLKAAISYLKLTSNTEPLAVARHPPRQRRPRPLELSAAPLW